MSNAPILIVDDNALNAKLATLLLSRAGYPVRVAVDVPEARKRIAEERPALILMDVQLPGIDGLTFTRELKSDPATLDIVVVALTACAMIGDVERVLSAGCDGYVSKPIDTRTFVETVAAHLPHRT